MNTKRTNSCQRVGGSRIRSLLCYALNVLACFGLAFEARSEDCSAPHANLVGWWSGDGNASDLVSGAGATLLTGVSYGPGKVGQAFELDGVNGGVVAGAHPNYDVGTASGMTVEAWIRPPRADLGPIVEWENGAVFWYGSGHLYANLASLRLADHVNGGFLMEKDT